MGSEDEQRSNCKLEQSESEDFHRSDVIFSHTFLPLGLPYEVPPPRLTQTRKRIEGCLSQAKTSCLGCQELLLPRRLAAQITADILSLSADEPCGVRGALVRLFLEATDALQELGTLAEVDRSVTPTFEVSVLLRPDVDSWPALWSLFRTGRVLRLRPEYRLVKRKLYSTGLVPFCLSRIACLNL
uniref:Uncharacterized protein n=1 Tax=Denticeps clupeoides TaxID=299321 RepID=A0AAY4DU35_9TELE